MSFKMLVITRVITVTAYTAQLLLGSKTIALTLITSASNFILLLSPNIIIAVNKNSNFLY